MNKSSDFIADILHVGYYLVLLGGYVFAIFLSIAVAVATIWGIIWMVGKVLTW
jgi:hypothetical protein